MKYKLILGAVALLIGLILFALTQGGTTAPQSVPVDSGQGISLGR